VLTAGRALLLIALAVALYGVGASLYGARTRRREWVDSGRRAMYALAGVLVGAFAILQAAFLRSDFSFELVATHSSTTTPTFYRATAVWSSQEGSLLLWVTLLALWSSGALLVSRKRLREVAPYAAAVLCAFATFFLFILIALESPFGRMSPVPAEGVGLNPLLRHPSMMIHPPMLYSGYTLFAVPFAFAVGALITRRLGAEWIRTVRPFALAAWFFLGIGIVLGARWSYSELGWGGYWAWDPVENASLMPWLTGTAFLHSLMIQEKRGMLKVWNVSLVLATGVLAVLGTFLVRSGILQSIHAFGASTLGVPFLTLIAAMIAISVYLVVTRARELRSEHRLDSWLSREAAFLGNNLVLVGMCFVVFWGTFFPLISEAVTGDEASVGPPWFNRAIVPGALLLVLLAGLGPVVAWRRVTPANLRRQLLIPATAGLGCLVALLAFGVRGNAGALAMFALGAFVAAVVAQEYWRGLRARRTMAKEAWPVALVQLVRRNRRRYGGYVVHLGIAVLFVGVAASSAFQKARDVDLTKGQSAHVGAYEFKYVEPFSSVVAAPNGRLERIDLGARLELRRDGRKLQTMTTRRSYFPSSDPSLGAVSRFFEGESTSEVALRAGATKDLWAVVAPNLAELTPRIDEGDKVFAKAGALPAAQREIFLAKALSGLAGSYAKDPPPATFRILVSPLVSWIWIGALIAFGGGLLAGWPGAAASRRTVTAGYAARLARELGRA
jgi:cytochrome c-type biogenesis protein CcmF